MNRRDLISAVTATVLFNRAEHVHAQQPKRKQRIGILTNVSPTDREGQVRIAAFLQGLQKFGWSVGSNVDVEIRWAEGDPARIRKYAAELIALGSDVILTTGSATTTPLLRATSSTPIVFVNVTDPVGAGLVKSMAQPGGNATGFTPFEYSMSGKWLELLLEAAPRVTKVAVVRDPVEPSMVGQFAAIQAAAPARGIGVLPIDIRDGANVEKGIGTLERASNVGLIVLVGASTTTQRASIIAHSASNLLPAIYPSRHFVVEGGLMSYGPSLLDQLRRAAGYVDRILKGEKPADLPVQAPTVYELVVNLKTAQALGLSLPPAILLRADEVIE